MTIDPAELTAKHARMQLKTLRRMLEQDQPSGAVRPPLATVPAKPE